MERIEEFKKVRIIANGPCGMGTEVIDLATGKSIGLKVQSIEILPLEIQTPNRARLNCFIDEMNIVAEVDAIYTTINGKKYELKEVSDGSH